MQDSNRVWSTKSTRDDGWTTVVAAWFPRHGSGYAGGCASSIALVTPPSEVSLLLCLCWHARASDNLPPPSRARPIFKYKQRKKSKRNAYMRTYVGAYERYFTRTNSSQCGRRLFHLSVLLPNINGNSSRRKVSRVLRLEISIM